MYVVMDRRAYVVIIDSVCIDLPTSVLPLKKRNKRSLEVDAILRHIMRLIDSE